jgi:hypothetical protein
VHPEICIEKVPFFQGPDGDAYILNFETTVMMCWMTLSGNIEARNVQMPQFARPKHIRSRLGLLQRGLHGAVTVEEFFSDI